MGRKWEIEHATHADVCQVLDERKEYLKCRHHKTSKTYGDIVKYITPGLSKALHLYRKLPHPEACKYFFVPPTLKGDNTVLVPKCIMNFNKTFMVGATVSPTSNQIRKLFHQRLMQATKDEYALKEFMKVLDAHGHRVQDNM